MLVSEVYSLCSTSSSISTSCNGAKLITNDLLRSRNEYNVKVTGLFLYKL